ncbi:hypothetical protein PGT21_050233 [Puccinia graminis f. sp. tritici]|uniref:Uncharacterized protein n=1 Tax=Puccinia graminis f. sp. tritici TaxID=56615 RepID=A0A5B0NML7_PUCGR|nr:hypothetical protein PGT21_050233 [Puccinia graminis f. sp. tritici]
MQLKIRNKRNQEYPQLEYKDRIKPGVTKVGRKFLISSASPQFPLRIWARLRQLFKTENTFSIGLKSGEYGGR